MHPRPLMSWQRWPSGVPPQGYVAGSRALCPLHHVDPVRLGEYLCKALGLPSPHILVVRKVSTMHAVENFCISTLLICLSCSLITANPTFHVRLGPHEYVLRKKPHGKLVSDVHVYWLVFISLLSPSSAHHSPCPDIRWHLRTWSSGSTV